MNSQKSFGGSKPPPYRYSALKHYTPNGSPVSQMTN